jgi:hypothetical protein
MLRPHGREIHRAEAGRYGVEPQIHLGCFRGALAPLLIFVPPSPLKEKN